MPAHEWYYSAVTYAADNGLMTGVGKNHFNPNSGMTRSMLVQVLYNMEGRPAVSGSSNFRDVKSTEWYASAVNWAAQNGIVSGYSKTEFGTDDPVTREQMASILQKYAQMKGYGLSAQASLVSFADAGRISPWARDAIEWAHTMGLINGMGDGRLAPEGTATRAQLAAVLKSYCEKIVK